MSKTLALVDHLLGRARRLQEMGLGQPARRLLERLSGFRELPQAVAEEVQQRLAALLADAEEYPQARRHLATALTHQPRNAEYHAQMARAFAEDETASADRALEHYRTALRLDPDNAHYLCE